jgi:cell division protein FtsW (lipid II flippase)
MSRRREFGLLLLVFAILGLGHWVVWQAYLPVWRAGYPGQDWLVFLGPALMALGWLVLSGILTVRRCPETLLLPLVALLCGIGILFLQRLAGGAAEAELSKAPSLLRDYHKQLVSFGVGWLALAAMLVVKWDYRALSRFKYSIAFTALGLLLITTVFGDAANGQQLTLNLRFIAFQPHDPVKLLLVVFMAAYLAEKRELLSFAAGHRGLLTGLDFRYMGPLVVLWLLVMAIIFVHKDLGTALLLFGAFLGILYLGTNRGRYVVIGLLMFLVGVGVAYTKFERVQTRVAIWQNPWEDSNGAGYQICQALMAFGNGRVIGAGLAGGYPERIPAVETDMIYAAISEDLGLVGAALLLGVILTLVGRLFHIGLRSPDPFGKLLAGGLGVTLAVQAWVILAGVTKLIPLTGVTLPFISYGGTSLVVNLALIGIALNVAYTTPAVDTPAS